AAVRAGGGGMEARAVSRARCVSRSHARATGLQARDRQGRSVSTDEPLSARRLGSQQNPLHVDRSCIRRKVAYLEPAPVELSTHDRVPACRSLLTQPIHRAYATYRLGEGADAWTSWPGRRSRMSVTR